MLHSQYSAAAQAAVAYVRSTIRYRGLNTAGGWIRNPLEVNQKFASRIYSLYTGAKRDAAYKGPFDPKYYINQLDRLARDAGTGNCSELSAVAFNYLEGKPVKPIDYFAVYRGSWNHAFVVLNRDSKVPVGDFPTWSYGAVLCDPLYDRFGDACMLRLWYAKMFPLKDTDVMCRVG